MVAWDEEDAGLLFAHITRRDRYEDILYLGCPHIYVAPDEESEVETLLRPLHCVPIFLDPSSAHGHYQVRDIEDRTINR